MDEYLEQIVARVKALLQTPPATKDVALESTRKKLWQAVAKLATSQSSSSAGPDSPKSPKGALSEVASVSSMASTQKWLQDAIKFRADIAKQAKDKKTPTLSDMIIRFVQRGPPSELMLKMISERELLAECRVEGYKQLTEMFADVVSPEERVRVLQVVFDALHTGSDIHFAAKLQGCNPQLTADLQTAWKDLASQVVASCRDALKSCDYSNSHANHELSALVIGVAVLIQDYRLSDVTLIKDCGLISLLDAVIQSPHILLRELAFKCVEIIVYRCCLQDFAKPASSPRTPQQEAAVTEVGEVNLLSGSTEAADTLLPGLMHILHSQLQLATDSNLTIPATSPRAPVLLGKEAFWPLQQTIASDPTEPGFVAPYSQVSTAHTLGVWIWRPHDYSNGTLITKAGHVAGSKAAPAWSSVAVKLVDGRVALAVADGTAVDSFSAVTNREIVTEGWTHFAYVVDINAKKVRLYLNGVPEGDRDLPPLLCTRKVGTKTTDQVVETGHNYDNNMDKYWTIAIPNAKRYTVTCDPRSQSENNYDFLRFYKGRGRSEVIGADKYTGRSFPGINGCSVLEINAPEFEMFFHSDGSNTEWGFKATITAYVEAAEADSAMASAEVNAHPFFLGQPPATASPLRSAKCALSNICVVNEAVDAEFVAQMPFATVDNATEGATGKLLLLKGGLCCCPAESSQPQNCYAYLPPGVNVVRIAIGDLDPATSGFSVGVALRQSIVAQRAREQVLVFGESPVSYGIAQASPSAGSSSSSREFNLQRFGIAKRRTLPRGLQPGDTVDITFDLAKSELEVRVSGDGLTVAQKFGLPASAKDPKDFVVGLSLGPGQAATLIFPETGAGCDVGLTLLQPVKSLCQDGLFGRSETLGVLGAVSRVSRVFLRRFGQSGMDRLLSHDLLHLLLQLSFFASSTSIRLAALQTSCLLFPHATPRYIALHIAPLEVHISPFSF